ncbi:MAG: class I adenylate-forming enzyme family protein, partial [Planctomycetota bacterium]|nr:class I adenylate-forming enzyme family protein [Planctomycetota bacterium]
MNVWTFLEDTARRAPRQVALTQGSRQLSYAEARDRALALAADLRSYGVQPGDRVGCLMHNDIDHWIAYFGLAAAGAVLVSINTRLTDGEQREILEHSGARWLVHDDDHALRAGVLERELVTVPERPEPGAPTSLLDADEPAQLYYTSGTTGSPKGVVLTHRNVC